MKWTGPGVLSRRIPGTCPQTPELCLKSCHALGRRSGIQTSHRFHHWTVFPVYSGSLEVLHCVLQLTYRSVCGPSVQVTSLRADGWPRVQLWGPGHPGEERGISYLLSFSTLPPGGDQHCSQGQSWLSRHCHNTEMMLKPSESSASWTCGRPGASDSEKCKFYRLQRMTTSKTWHMHTHICICTHGGKKSIGK